jgi:pyroglutamyl-peptidase
MPPLKRDGALPRRGAAYVTLEQLVDAGEAMLLEMVRLTRQAARTSSATS